MGFQSDLETAFGKMKDGAKDDDWLAGEIDDKLVAAFNNASLRITRTLLGTKALGAVGSPTGDHIYSEDVDTTDTAPAGTFQGMIRMKCELTGGKLKSALQQAAKDMKGSDKADDTFASAFIQGIIDMPLNVTGIVIGTTTLPNGATTPSQDSCMGFDTALVASTYKTKLLNDLKAVRDKSSGHDTAIAKALFDCAKLMFSQRYFSVQGAVHLKLAMMSGSASIN